MTPDNAPTPDYTAARDYADRVLAHPNQYGTEEVAAARLLQHLLPDPTLAEMTTPDRAATVGMWATIDPGDDSNPWRGIITRANRTVALICNPTDMRMGMKPTAVTASIVTPDPTVPRAWNPNGTPTHPEPTPGSTHTHGNDRPRDMTLTPGSTWNDGHHLEKALDQSPYTRAVVIDRDNDLALWADGYWEGAGYQPGITPNEGPWKIIWVGTNQ